MEYLELPGWGPFFFGVPAKSITPGNFDFVDLYAARLSETEADVVPVVLEQSISTIQAGLEDYSRQIAFRVVRWGRLRRYGALFPSKRHLQC
jgi:hypothetical protein